MTISRFKVFSGGRKFDGKGEATVMINRDNNLIAVRPARRRRIYELRLEDVAEIIIWRVLRAEMADKKKAKAAARKARRA